jgi:hypothetical protein
MSASRLCIVATMIAQAACYCPTCNRTLNITYFESYAPFSVSEPLSCPPHSSIPVQGGTSLDNCTCVTGYKKSGDVCTAVQKAVNAAVLPAIAAVIGGGFFSFAWLHAAQPQPHTMFEGIKIAP